MGWKTDLYASVAELKSYLRIDDSDDDDQITLALNAASRAIDRACHRGFGQDDPALVRTYFGIGERGYSDQFIRAADISTTTDLQVELADSNDWLPSYTQLTLSDDYILTPVDADQDGWPWTGIVLRGIGAGEFRIRVTAKFGWTAVPDAIKQACLIQASRILKRRESPFGIAGSPDLGSELRLLEKLDPDVGVLIQHYKRRWAVV